MGFPAQSRSWGQSLDLRDPGRNDKRIKIAVVLQSRLFGTIHALRHEPARTISSSTRYHGADATDKRIRFWELSHLGAIGLFIAASLFIVMNLAFAIAALPNDDLVVMIRHPKHARIGLLLRFVNLRKLEMPLMRHPILVKNASLLPSLQGHIVALKVISSNYQYLPITIRGAKSPVSSLETHAQES